MKIFVMVFRVFVNKERKFGNPVGIVVDEKQELTFKTRQKVAAKLDFSETVFVDDVKAGSIQMFNPKKEVDFAGHALVGTSYFINKVLKQNINTLICLFGKVQTWQENDFTWIRAGLEGTPPWHRQQLNNEESLINLSPNEFTKHTIVWSWINESKGLIRARTFAPDWGIPEDEANGSGAMQLAASLKRKLEIHHGKGAIIYASPSENGFANVGGRVKKDSQLKIVL